MEFWASLAKEEKNIESNPAMLKFLTGPIGERLVDVLLQNLCCVDEQDEEGNGISESAASTLEAIFEGDSTEYEQKILAFTSSTIHHENWKYRQASIRAFATLLIGLPESRSQALVNSSLLELVALLNDSNICVKLSAIKSLVLISEEVSEVILQHDKVLQILEVIVKVGQVGEHFLKHTCKVVDNLCAPDLSRKVLGPHAGNLVKLFLDLCLENGRSIQAISSCLNVIINLIKCSLQVSLCNTYIDYVLANYPKLHGLEP